MTTTTEVKPKKAQPEARYDYATIKKMVAENPDPSMWAKMFNRAEFKILAKGSGMVGGDKDAAMDSLITKLVKAGTDEAKEALAAIETLVNLTKSLCTPGETFEVRFDQRGFGYAKITPIYKWVGPEGEEKQVPREVYDKERNYDTIDILKAVQQ